MGLQNFDEIKKLGLQNFDEQWKQLDEKLKALMNWKFEIWGDADFNEFEP